MATQKINGVYHVSNTEQGGGGGSDPNAVKYTPQTLTDGQKEQARTNIGAGTYTKPGTGIPKTDLANDAQPHSPYVGQNGNWFEWDDQTGAYVDTNTEAQGPQGNTGSSVDYPYELVNNLTTDDATKGLSAAQGVVLEGEISQLSQELHTLSGKFYGVFEDVEDLPEGYVAGYAIVGTSEPFAIYNFDGEDWTDSGARVTGIMGEPGVGFQSVSSQEDGTIVITLTDRNTIMIDLNHDHPAYPKYQLCADEAEYQAIATKESDKLYLIPEV